MTNKKVLNIVIGLIAFVGLLMIVVAVFQPGITPTKVSILAAQPTSTRPNTATPEPTITPHLAAPTNSPTSKPTAALAPSTATIAPAITGTPSFTKPPTTVPTTSTSSGGIPTITNGPEYPTKFAEKWLFIKPVTGTPIVSREDALKAIFLRGENPPPFTIVSDHQIVENGQTILYTAYYGLVTEGYRAPSGPWLNGDVNIPISNCTVGGKCVATGEVLDHIENRPMWLIDLEVTVQPSLPTCPPAGTPCPVPLLDNHSVGLVDVQTLMVMGGVTYYQP